jgi:uncharacterized protein
MKKIFTYGTGGRTAVITGASSGIGAAFARRLAAEGFNVVLVARRKELLDRLAREIAETGGVRAKAVAADLSSDKGVRLVEKLLAGDDTVDVLVNAAGFGTRGFFMDVEAEKSERMVYLHTMATMKLTRAVLPKMAARKRGYVILVSSLGAFFTTSHYTLYSATKAFINMFTLGLRDELEGTGVKVQALCPGLTDTGFMRTAEFSDFNYGDIPRFVWMSPEYVADKSLSALKRADPIFIPGLGNRIFVGTLTAPVIGTIVGRILSALGRGKNAY